MKYNFKEIKESNMYRGKSYFGISVGKTGIFLSKQMSEHLKDYHHIIICTDKENKAIKLILFTNNDEKKTNIKGIKRYYKLNTYCFFVSCREMHKIMKIGRYLYKENDNNEYIFVKEKGKNDQNT